MTRASRRGFLGLFGIAAAAVPFAPTLARVLATPAAGARAVPVATANGFMTTGAILQINMTSAGSGYSCPPVVMFTDGVGACGRATLAVS